MPACTYQDEPRYLVVVMSTIVSCPYCWRSVPVAPGSNDMPVAHVVTRWSHLHGWPDWWSHPCNCLGRLAYTTQQQQHHLEQLLRDLAQEEDISDLAGCAFSASAP